VGQFRVDGGVCALIDGDEDLADSLAYGTGWVGVVAVHLWGVFRGDGLADEVEGDFFGGAFQHPSAATGTLCCDKAGAAQAGEQAADYHCVGANADGQIFGSDSVLWRGCEKGEDVDRE
jgi:hypothetical protein